MGLLLAFGCWAAARVKRTTEGGRVALPQADTVAAMASVLILGIDPHAVPGMDGVVMRRALDAELARFDADGLDSEMALVGLDGSDEIVLTKALSERQWDVVVVGGGIRKPEPLHGLFEMVVNLIRRHGSQAAIAFNTSGGDSLEAAPRWL
jgi:hypothetical protein